MQVTYPAEKIAGKATNGRPEGTSVADAARSLRNNGLSTTSRVREKPGSSAAPPASPLRFGGRISRMDLLMLTSQLSIMVRSGVDLADALRGVADDCENARLQRILNDIYDRVASGDTISAAMGRHRSVFGADYIAAVQAGEASGRMADVLSRLAALRQYELRLRNTIVGVLTYPVILSVVALLVCMAMIFFVLPQFAEVFRDLERPVPASTQLMMDVSVLIRTRFLYLLPISAAAAFCLWKLFRNEFFRLRLDKFLLNLKAAGPALRSLIAGRTFTLVGTMLESDIPLMEALQLVRGSVSNRVYLKMFDRLEEDVTNGKGISPSLTESDCLPRGAAQMISTAEKTGKLGEVMQTVGRFYEEEGERQVKEAVKLLEPAIILSMGVFVSVIVLSVMLPLLDVSTVSE